MVEPRDLEQDGPLDAQLAALPARDVDPWRAEQIRRRASAELQRQAELARRPWLAALTRVYGRAIEPALVSAVTCAYLFWALSTAYELLAHLPRP
jgi:hypothetical protein